MGVVSMKLVVPLWIGMVQCDAGSVTPLYYEHVDRRDLGSPISYVYETLMVTHTS